MGPFEAGRYRSGTMALRRLFAVLLSLALTTACGAQPGPAAEPAIPGTATEVQAENRPADEPLPPAETAAPVCPGDEVSSIGQSIADDYESASYEQVISWFCNGAEFEDILVALETESQTGTPAEEMLQMLADGFTWDEIWQTIGLTD